MVPEPAAALNVTEARPVCPPFDCTATVPEAWSDPSKMLIVPVAVAVATIGMPVEILMPTVTAPDADAPPTAYTAKLEV